MSDAARKSFREQMKQLLWEQNPTELSWMKRTLLRQLQTVVLVGRDFAQNRCLLYAASLTYYTMLSLVPLLALTFALLKAFGVQNLLEPIIMDKLNVGNEEALQTLLGYINNTQVGGMGGIGLLFLLIAVTSLLTNVEAAFNHIWGVDEIRPMVRRFSDYLSVILVGPVLIISAISMTSTLASYSLVKTLMDMQLIGNMILLVLKIAPFVFMWLAFTVLYIFMSNIKVVWRAAFVGGVVGGTLWQMAQWGYVNFQVGVAKYNAIYGAMAALPIFMVWLYLSWVIVLFGLQVTYAKQNLRTSGRDLRGEEVSRTCYEQLAMVIMVTLADRFSRGESALTQEQLAKLLFIPPRLCRNILQHMVALGFVSELCSRLGRRSYQLGRAAENLKVSECLRVMRNQGERVLHLKPHPQTRVAVEVCGEFQLAMEEGLQGVTLKDLVQRCQERGAAEVEVEMDELERPYAG